MTPPAQPGSAHEQARRHRARDLLRFARSSFLLVGIFPFVLPLARAHLPLGPIGIVADAVFVVVCHRLPERTLQLAEVSMPVCSRCGGIYAGLALGALLCWPRLSLRVGRIALILSALIMVTDVAAQDLGYHALHHPSRLATGALLGWVACATLMAAIIREQVKPAEERPALAQRGPPPGLDRRS